MKHWEKIMKLDSDYVEARKQLVLGQCVAVEIKIIKEPKKHAPKPSTAKSSQ
jgi:hypothetical protein